MASGGHWCFRWANAKRKADETHDAYSLHTANLFSRDGVLLRIRPIVCGASAFSLTILFRSGALVIPVEREEK